MAVYFLHIANSLAFAAVAFSILYLVPFSLAGCFHKAKLIDNPVKWPSLAVIIPAYCEDAVIYDTAFKAANHSYPGNFHVFVIADSLTKHTLTKLGELPITIHIVSFDKSTKTKAVNESINRIAPGNFDAFVFLDADNVMEDSCLLELALQYSAGSQVVQGRRVAKNLNTGIAHLDAFSEAIGNHIFRRGHYVLGFSSALIGSGFLIDNNLLRKIFSDECFDHDSLVGGFDKKLETYLLYKEYSIDYTDSAIIYDEKSSDFSSFMPQRTRWIAAQTYHLFSHFKKAFHNLLKFDKFDYVNKVLQMLLLPRSLIIAISLLLFFLNFIIGLSEWYTIWSVCLLLLLVVLWLSIPSDRPNLSLRTAIFYLPYGIALMVVAAIRSPRGRQGFLHTPHQSGDHEDPSAPTRS